MVVTIPIYNQIGFNYNSTRKADPFITQTIINSLEAVPKVKYLDLACGTGNYTYAYHLNGLDFVGVDESKLMIEQAALNQPQLRWAIGNAENLPFENSVFNGITCTNAIHHFKNLQLVFKECVRVLKSGNLVIFCSTREQMKNYWLKHYFPKMMRRSTEQMPTLNAITDSLERAGFQNIKTSPYFVQSDLQDLFLYSGKNRPDLYLDEGFRRNISSFASLAETDEVNNGIEMLKVDIENGTIHKLIERSHSNAGDYLFVSGSRT